MSDGDQQRLQRPEHGTEIMLSRCAPSQALRYASIRQYSTQPRNYASAVADLNTLQTNFAIVELIRKSRQGMNLQAIPEMIRWCQRIGYETTDFDQLNPIHIAGTKGKGSTSSFISSILSQYLPTKLSIDAERLPSSVGLYTSPHLRFVRERIQLNNKPISEEQFTTCFYDVWDRLEQSARTERHPDPSSVATKPVYFRFLTLMAFHHYMQTKVGTAVVECGIGGEYDSTNVLVKPSITGITSLGIDHTALLGDTIESIAWHKAGIFKQDVPAFTTPQPAAAMKVLSERACQRHVDLHVTPDYTSLQEVKLGLFGEFQKLNAALAIAISSTHLQRLGFSNLPDPLDRETTLPPQFIKGLEDTRLGGRCEKRQDTLSKLSWYIDGGHTLESIKLAGGWFAHEVQQDNPRILIFNQQTRDASALARSLHKTLTTTLGASPFQHVIFCTNTTYKTAGYKADLISINIDSSNVESLKVQKELAETWEQLDSSASIHVVSTIEEAIGLARDVAGGCPATVLATGSLHLVGGIIDILEVEIERLSND